MISKNSIKFTKQEPESSGPEFRRQRSEIAIVNPNQLGLIHEASHKILFDNREHKLDIPRVLRATPAALPCFDSVPTQSSKERITEAPGKELKHRAKDAILLDDFFMKKVSKEEKPRKTLHRALLEFQQLSLQSQQVKAVKR